jgi:hypothetical protein
LTVGYAHRSTRHYPTLASRYVSPYWKKKSMPKSREPRIPRETIALIKQMARENPRWASRRYSVNCSNWRL